MRTGTHLKRAQRRLRLSSLVIYISHSPSVRYRDNGTARCRFAGAWNVKGFLYSYNKGKPRRKPLRESEKKREKLPRRHSTKEFDGVVTMQLFSSSSVTFASTELFEENQIDSAMGGYAPRPLVPFVLVADKCWNDKHKSGRVWRGNTHRTASYRTKFEEQAHRDLYRGATWTTTRTKKEKRDDLFLFHTPNDVLSINRLTFKKKLAILCWS